MNSYDVTGARGGKKRVWRGKGGGVKCLEVGFEGVQRRFVSEKMGKVIPCRGTKGIKDTGTKTAKSAGG